MGNLEVHGCGLLYREGGQSALTSAILHSNIGRKQTSTCNSEIYSPNGIPFYPTKRKRKITILQESESDGIAESNLHICQLQNWAFSIFITSHEEEPHIQSQDRQIQDNGGLVVTITLGHSLA